ncbi:MAG: DUF3034 family protein [Planctomycetota bacterium]|jgi:hypothetical protein
MTHKLKHLTVLAILAPFVGVADAGPPIPSHTVEGNSGVLITSTAYLVNPAEQGELLGMPSFSATALFFAEKDFESFAVVENIAGNMEIGYAYERLGMGGWPDDVKNALGVTINRHVGLHNFNLRYMAIQEGDLDCPWMPAVTFGAHVKWNESQTELDRDVGGLLDFLGSDHSGGTELTVVASEMIYDLLPWPVMISAGLRNGDAIQTGLLGFAGERSTTFEGSVVAFLSERLAVAAEYRQKPDFLDTFSIRGYDLIKQEEDWFTLAMAFSINEVTAAGAYANFASFANRNEDNVLGVQLRYDF